MAFLLGQSWRVLKSWYTGGGPEQGFRCCFADGLNQSLVSSVAQATLWKAFLKRCAFGDRFHWIRVDGRSNWKLSVFKQKRIRVDGTLDRPHLSGICTLCVYLVEHLFPRMMDDCLSMAWPTPCHWNLSLSLLDYCLSYPRLKLFEKTKILIKQWWLSQTLFSSFGRFLCQQTVHSPLFFRKTFDIERFALQTAILDAMSAE